MNSFFAFSLISALKFSQILFFAKTFRSCRNDTFKRIEPGKRNSSARMKDFFMTSLDFLNHSKIDKSWSSLNRKMKERGKLKILLFESQVWKFGEENLFQGKYAFLISQNIWKTMILCCDKTRRQMNSLLRGK